jgi:hypothetical protein
MSPEKQRIAIAMACGWTDIRRQRLYLGDQDLWGTKLIGGEKHRNRLPDYHNDLNAMHEAEKVLTYEQKEQFVFWMNHIHPSADIHHSDTQKDFRLEVFSLVHSPASQRCEAFLRTLGLWEEETNTAKSVSPTSPVTEESSVVQPLVTKQIS